MSQAQHTLRETHKSTDHFPQKNHRFKSRGYSVRKSGVSTNPKFYIWSISLIIRTFGLDDLIEVVTVTAATFA